MVAVAWSAGRVAGYQRPDSAADRFDGKTHDGRGAVVCAADQTRTCQPGHAGAAGGTGAV